MGENHRRNAGSPRGETPPPEPGEVSRDEIWASAQARIPARGEFFHSAQDSRWWRDKLIELTATFENKQPI